MLPAVWLLSLILPCWFLRRVLEGSPGLLVVLIDTSLGLITARLTTCCRPCVNRPCDDHLNVSTATSSCLERLTCPNAMRKWSFPKRGPSPKREDTPLCARESNPKREVASTTTLFGATPTSPHKIPKSPARLMIREVAALANSMTPSTLRELGIH